MLDIGAAEAHPLSQPFEQPQLASQQPFPPPQHPSFPQQLSLPQQPSAQPHDASQQQLFLRLNNLLKKQERIFLQQHPLEAQPQLASQQLLLPQQPSEQPQEASQQPFPPPQQPLAPQQSSAHPHEASPPQQPPPQHPSFAPQQPSEQPQDFSQQQHGSTQSHPQPFPSIVSNKPKPKLWPVRQTLTMSAPNNFDFIE